ncbi:uncharacterized protein LOC144348757, partial [Saccoglossus kowalevskii]
MQDKQQDRTRYICTYSMESTFQPLSQGLFKQVIQPGCGPPIKPGDVITVHCTGSITTPPKKFWSTTDPGQTPFTFQVGVGKVIAGWDEGCLSMMRGERAMLVKCYFLNIHLTIPPNADLMFDIIVLAVN